MRAGERLREACAGAPTARRADPPGRSSLASQARQSALRQAAKQRRRRQNRGETVRLTALEKNGKASYQLLCDLTVWSDDLVLPAPATLSLVTAS